MAEWTDFPDWSGKAPDRSKGDFEFGRELTRFGRFLPEGATAEMERGFEAEASAMFAHQKALEVEHRKVCRKTATCCALDEGGFHDIDCMMCCSTLGRWPVEVQA